MTLTKIHFLPIFVFILIPSSFIITYCIAVHLGHVETGFPYISDTGTYVPESCIFSQLVNLVAALLAATIYFRYKLIEQHYRDNLSAESARVLRINFVAALVGWIGSFGVSVLSNFQETSVIIVHMVGSLTAFGCATIYSWLHSVISFHVCPLLNSLLIFRIRILLSTLISVSFVSTLTFGIIAKQKFNGKSPTKWHPSDGGFLEHVISTASEWTLVICFSLFILSFMREMKKIAISSPQVHFMVEGGEMYSTDLYTNDDRIAIAHSHSTSSVKMNSAPPPYREYGDSNSMITTRAVVH